MNWLTAILALQVTLMGGLWPFGGDDREQPRRDETIGGLEERELQLDAEPQLPDGAALAREQYRMFLELSEAQPELRGEAMRRLADLSLEAGEAEQFGALAGDGSGYYDEAITLYEALLAELPEGGEADAILYQLGRAYDTLGRTDQALAALDRLVLAAPNSRYYAEAQFRRGEILFIAKRYGEAAAAYAAVIDRGDASRYFESALYKHGWTLFKQSEHERSLGSFIAVLDGQLDVPDVGARLAAMSRPERELVDDTLRVLGLTFSYLDGAASIDRLLDRRGHTGYADLLYAGLGDLFLDKERYQDAAETYAAFVDRQPTHQRSPELQARVIDAYTLGKFPTLVLDAKRRYVELYGLDSGFWAGRDRADHAGTVAALKQHLSDLANHDHAQAQQHSDLAAYERAAQWYRRYLDYFPDDPDSAQRSFLLAEIYFELERYRDATLQYLDAAYGYGPHPQAAEAAYAALLSARAWEQMLDEPARSEWRALTIEESLRFADHFPAHEQAAPVRTRVAEELFAAGALQRAAEVAGLVVTAQPPAPLALERTALTVIAHAEFDLGRFREAEQAYGRLKLLPPGDGLPAAEIEERIASAVYRQAEQAQAVGDIDTAVGEFLRVGNAAPGSAIVATSVYDAAALLINAERWPAAIDVLERLRRDFPGHEFQDDVTQKLAVARLAAGQPAAAAGEFERVAALASVGAEVHREALWQAADLYAAAGQAPAEIRVLDTLVARFPQPLAESIEARQRLAELAEPGEARRRRLQSVIDADAAGGAQRTERSRTLAARAALELAHPARDAFYAAALSMPLTDSLKLKKSRMEAALAGYGRAADYGVAEVTTAATFEIGELYFRLSRELMASPRPDGLSDEELEQYEILLEEQAFPFEEQAIDIFTANADRAAEGIYDASVQRSFARLAELMPGRYAKRERSEHVIAQID